MNNYTSLVQHDDRLRHFDAEWERIAEEAARCRLGCRRLGQRCAVHAPVSVICKRSAITSVMLDLSVSGCAIEGSTPARVGDVAMLLVDSGECTRLVLEGRCRRTSMTVTAFEFSTSLDSDRLTIAEFQDRLYQRTEPEQFRCL
jgi:hypothetical protein